MNKIKVGVAGLGRLGYTHAHNLAFNIKNARLTAVCSLNEEELRTAKTKLNVEFCYTDIDDMLKDNQLEALVIATPSDLHGEHIIKGLKAGLHVFCEKPLGINMEDCENTEREVAGHSDKIFMLGFMRRYDASYQYAKQKIEDGYIGKPILMRSHSMDSVESIESTLAYLPHSAGQFMDMSIHDFDLARWILKCEPKSILAMGACYEYKEFAKYGDGDNVTALMQFENDTMVFVFAGRAAAHGYVVETEIIGTKASLRIGAVSQKNLVELLDNNGITKECTQSFPDRFSKAFEAEMEEFFQCILGNHQPSVGVRDGVRATQIATMAARSFKENKYITL